MYTKYRSFLPSLGVALDNPDTGPRYPCRYQLRIVVDYDGIEWVHFFGAMEFVRTYQELPDKLAEQLEPIIKYFMKLRLERLELTCRPGSLFLIDGEYRTLEGAPEGTLETLRLCAWYLDWRWRREMAGLRNSPWRCLECSEDVPATRTHCANASCTSWNILYEATGIVILQPVPKAQSA